MENDYVIGCHNRHATYTPRAPCLLSGKRKLHHPCASQASVTVNLVSGLAPGWPTSLVCDTDIRAQWQTHGYVNTRTPFNLLK